MIICIVCGRYYYIEALSECETKVKGKEGTLIKRGGRRGKLERGKGACP